MLSVMMNNELLLGWMIILIPSHPWNYKVLCAFYYMVSVDILSLKYCALHRAQLIRVMSLFYTS